MKKIILTLCGLLFLLLIRHIRIFLHEQEIFAQQNHAAQLHNHANAMINHATERNDALLKEALSGYETALHYRNHPETRYNTELLQQTLKNIATENIQQPTTGNGQSSSGQSITDNGQPTTGNGQPSSGWLTQRAIQQLQDYQDSLQQQQLHYSKDFGNNQQHSFEDDFFGGSLFEQFFGQKNPFKEEIPGGHENEQNR